MNAFGIDIRGGSGLLVRTFLQDVSGYLVKDGTTHIYFEEPQNDGTIKSYDFNDGTFKTGALTTPQASATHRKGNNGTRDTGLWTYMHNNTSGFTEGNIYFVQTSSTYASPQWQTREFQYGSGVFSSVVHMNSGVISTLNPVVLSSSQPYHRPAKSGEQMDLVNAPNATAITYFSYDLLNYNVGFLSNAGTVGRAIVLGGVPVGETTAEGTPTTSGIRLAYGSTMDNYYQDMQLMTNPNSSFNTQSRVITRYIGATRECQFDEPFVVAPSSGDKIVILGAHSHSKTQLADQILTRDFSQVSGVADRSLLNATRFLRNKWYTDPNYLYVTSEDDSTIAWSGQLSIVNGGSGITGMDPF